MACAWVFYIIRHWLGVCVWNQDALAQLLSDLRRDLTVAMGKAGHAESDAKAAKVCSFICGLHHVPSRCWFDLSH
eukprot:m.233066 g.233066  ORF g.233066 m.233066 type:complete len:75 (-) comp19284_c0_seq22:114-338(-)